MCFNCGDFIGLCSHEECHKPEGGIFSKYPKFYVGDRYCKHLAEFYGHEIATWDDLEVEIP